MSADLSACVAPGQRVYLPAASGALPTALLLSGDAGRWAGTRIVTCLVPGIDEAADLLRLPAEVETFMLPAAFRDGFASGRVKVRPLPYSGIASFVACTELEIAIAHVAPPDGDGRCSFGIAADFSPLAWARAARRVAVVNARMPRLPGAAIDLAAADEVIEIDMPVSSAPASARNAEAEAIARRAAALVRDGDSVQAGLGQVPSALWRHLARHRDLRVASGIVIDDVAALAQAGALAPFGHRSGLAYGSPGFYDFLAESGLVAMRPTTETHDVAAIPNFVSVNSALEVDLFGQANLEWRGGRLFGGVGGAPDFMRGAVLSPGGRSILALPATARGGTVSRIVARLDAPAVSIGRDMIDHVVTEHGHADLRGLDIDGRAAALIAIAAPSAQAELAAAWHGLRRTI